VGEHELAHWSGIQKQQVYEIAEWLDKRVRDVGVRVLEWILSGGAGEG
jgi:hypothetical protein